MSDLKTKIVKGVFWYTTQHWGGTLASFITFLILVRILKPEDFGLMALASVFIAFAQLFMDTGLSLALVQKKELDEIHTHTAFWSILLTGIILTAIGILCSPLIAIVFNEDRLAAIIAVLSITFFTTSIGGTHQALMERNLEMKKLAKRALFSKSAGSIAGIGSALSGLGVWSLVVQQITNSLFSSVSAWWIHAYRPLFRFSSKSFKELFSFGLNVIGVRITGFLNTRLDDLLIGYLLGSRILGYYSVAYRLVTTIQNLVGNLGSSVALPAFARLQDEKEKLKSAFLSATRFAGFIGFPVFLLLVVLAPNFIPVLFGSDWSPSILVVQILAIAGLLQTFMRFNGNIVRDIGQTAIK